MPKGPSLDPAGQAPGGARRGPPARLRRLRGHDPQGRVRRRHRDGLGPGPLVPRGRGCQGSSGGLSARASSSSAWRARSCTAAGCSCASEAAARRATPRTGCCSRSATTRRAKATRRRSRRRPDSVLTGRSLEQIAADAKAGTARRRKRKRRLRLAVDLAKVPGARAAPLPARLAPQLATLVAEAPTGDDWLHEIKYDGYRVMCRLEEGKARLLHAARRRLDDPLPLIARRGGAHPRAQRDPRRRGGVRRSPTGAPASRSWPARCRAAPTRRERIVYYVFDLLYLDGYDLTGVPLLRAQGGAAPAARRVCRRTPGCGMWSMCRASGRSSSTGPASSRSRGRSPSAATRLPAGPRARLAQGRSALRRQEFVIGGFTERAGGHGGIGALLLGSPRGGRRPAALRRPRRHGLGREDDDRPARPARRAPAGGCAVRRPAAEGKAAAGVTWVRPHLVAEVEYLSWDGRGAFGTRPSKACGSTSLPMKWWPTGGTASSAAGCAVRRVARSGAAPWGDARDRRRHRHQQPRADHVSRAWAHQARPGALL